MGVSKSQLSFHPGTIYDKRERKLTNYFGRGDAHPRVTGCPAEHKAFVTIEKAREYMKKMKVTKHTEVIKDGAGETSPLWNTKAYYAVAHGKQPGIYEYW